MNQGSHPTPGGPPPDWAGGAALGLMVGAATAALVLVGGAALTHWAGPTGWPGLDGPGLFSWGEATWWVMVGALPSTDPWWWWLAAPLVLALVLGTIAGIWAGWAAGRPPAADVQVRGRRLSSSPKEAAREMEQECEVSGEGVWIHPHPIPLSLDRETRGILVLGSIGGGKTQVIQPLILEALDRGDQLIIHDNKGDFTAGLLGEPGVYLMAPWDTRSLKWDVAEDCQSRADARELAARLIPDAKSGDPMWTLGARQILSGLVRHCQVAKPGKWTFKDLAEAASSPFPRLRQIVAEHAPEALLLLGEERGKPTKTAQSFLSTLSAYLQSVFDLADAWSPDGHGGKLRRFSIRRWLTHTESPEARGVYALIMQGHGRYRSLAQAYIQGLVASLGSLVNSPDLHDSRERRLWLFLDELPQLGKVEGLGQFIEIGRSKGVRTVIGTQDISQLKELYGEHTVQSWASMIGTYLIARTQGVETPRWLSDLIGQREVKRYAHSVTAERNMMGAAAATGSATGAWQHAQEDLITPDELAQLGPGKKGVTSLLLTGGPTVYRLVWPYSSLPQDAPTTQPAPWTDAAWPNSAAAAAALREEEIQQAQQQEEHPAAPPPPPPPPAASGMPPDPPRVDSQDDPPASSDPGDEGDFAPPPVPVVDREEALEVVEEDDGGALAPPVLLDEEERHQEPQDQEKEDPLAELAADMAKEEMAEAVEALVDIDGTASLIEAADHLMEALEEGQGEAQHQPIPQQGEGEKKKRRRVRRRRPPESESEAEL